MKSILLIFLILFPNLVLSQNEFVKPMNVAIPKGYDLDGFLDLDYTDIIIPSWTRWNIPDTVSAKVFITRVSTGDTIRILYQGNLNPGRYDIFWHGDYDNGLKAENDHYYFEFFSESARKGLFGSEYRKTFKGKLRFKLIWK